MEMCPLCFSASTEKKTPPPTNPYFSNPPFSLADSPGRPGHDVEDKGEKKVERANASPFIGGRRYWGKKKQRGALEHAGFFEDGKKKCKQNRTKKKNSKTKLFFFGDL